MNGAGLRRPVGFVWDIWVGGWWYKDLIDVGESDM